MGDTLHKMQVIIEATTEPLKKGMENSRREVKKSVEEIQKETEKVKNPFKGMESKALQPVRNTLNKIREMLSRNPVKNFQIKAGIKVPTEEYAELQKNLLKAQQSLEKLQEKQHKFENTGKPKENQQWKSLVVDITRAEKKLSEYKDAAAKMETSGTAFKQTPTDEYREIRNSVKSLNEEIEKYEKKGEKLEAMGVKKESKQWRSLIYDIEQARGKLFEYEEKMKSLEKSGKSTQQVPTEEYQKIQKDILKVNKELDAYREKKNKLQALGVSKESQEWKSLNSTSTGLKNNAKNADTASKAAKQYQRTLLGFDQINKLNDDSDSSGSGGTGSGTDTSPLGGVNDMFQTTAIKSRFKDLAKLIKDSWKSGDFTELGAMVGNKLNEALERIPWGKIQNTCNKIAKSIATFLNGFIEATDWKLVGNTFSKGLNTAFGFVDTFAKNFHWNSLGKAIGDGINGALEGLDWNLIKGTVHDTVFGLVSTLNTAIATTNWSVVGKTVGECFNTRLEALYTTVHNFNWRGLGTALADLVTNTVKTIDTGKIGQTLSDGIKGFFDFAISAIEHMDWWSMGDTIYNKAKDLMVNIDWSGIADRVFETIGAAFGGFAAFIGGIFKNAVADARKYIIKHFTEAGKFTWEGFKNGVVQSFKDIGTWIKAHIFKPFINGFKKAFGIHSPSTVMRTQGGYVISGLFNGMKAGLPAVLSWIAKLPGQTKERLGNAKTWLRGKGNAAIIGLKNGWEAVRESTFLSRVKKIGSQSFNAIGDIKSKVTPKGRDIISGMRTGLNNNWSSLSGILSNIPGKVANAIPSLYTVGQNVIQTFANGFSSIHIPMPHIGWDWEGGSIKIGNFKFSLPRFNLSWYANGGFPGMGEMFVARESGPELVGRMGNHSAVANNNQIIAGIRAGVFEAVVNAFESMQGRNDRGQELHIYLEGDAKKLFKVIRQEGNNYQKQTGNPVFG